MIIVLLILILAVLAFLVWSCADIGSGIWVKAKCRHLGPSSDAVTLTFDDGPDPVVTPQVLDVLAKYGVKAVFFVVGEKAEAHPALVRRIVEEGHRVGNHSYSHSGLFPLSGRACIHHDLLACDSAIDSSFDYRQDSSSDAVQGREKLFRPPFGVTNPDIARALRSGQWTVVGWDVRSYDTAILGNKQFPTDYGTAPSDSEATTFESGAALKAVAKCAGRVVAKTRPGSVILLHDRLPLAPALVETIIPQLLERGMKLS